MKSQFALRFLFAAAVVALSAGALFAADSKPQAPVQKTCPVSGEKLGEMGDPVVIKQDGREVKLCCKSCMKDFKKDPAKYLAKIDAELKLQAK